MVMGNNESKKNLGPSIAKTETTTRKRNPILEQHFNKIASADGILTQETLQGTLGKELGALMKRYFKGFSSSSSNGCIDVNCFIEGATILLSENSNTWIQLFFYNEKSEKNALTSEEVSHMIQVCRCAAQVSFHFSNNDEVSEDQKLLDLLLSSIKETNESFGSLQSLGYWIEIHCPRMIVGLQEMIRHRLLNTTAKYQCPPSTSQVVSPFLMWFIFSSVPSYYIPVSSSKTKIDESGSSALSNSEQQWVCLYCSLVHGLSTNRFESNVFGYKGPTVLIVRFTDDSVFCVGVDQSWKCDTKPLGGSNCFVMQLLPIYRRFPQSSGLLLYNVKTRGIPLGLTVGSDVRNNIYFKMEKDFSNVDSFEVRIFVKLVLLLYRHAPRSITTFEVWACGGTELLAEQHKQKQWELRQVEQNKKVPLPGKWEENPDRYLLELAGLNIYNRDQIQPQTEDEK